LKFVSFLANFFM